MPADNPHFAFPFRRGVSGTQVVVTEQDSDDEVVDCVMVLLQTDIGEHPGIPEYGLEDQTFQEGGIDLEYVKSVIREYEDRAIADFEDYEIVDLLHRVKLIVSARESTGG